jgi:hypothetical protein
MDREVFQTQRTGIGVMRRNACNRLGKGGQSKRRKSGGYDIWEAKRKKKKSTP